ncbi:MAG: hypothetical protein ACK4SF_05675 [Algoriphagus aquaeductus]|jgi:hypothetical protein|uniref:Uncharacterized protein n=1 Tax=Algoriphagus aquaeductus TaxID=475299 RepID=A0A326RUD7_9BACT|nr:hypothetical protein [Algoriphagus aquaeductus]PZV84540.1 hypothetical protein CLV31_104191 [Algoriphagus aquaeductus]
MKQLFEIEIDSPEILDEFRELARKYQLSYREWKLAKSENPSPSGDPFFDNPENVKEILRRKKEIEIGSVESVKLSQEAIKKLFGAT